MSRNVNVSETSLNHVDIIDSCVLLKVHNNWTYPLSVPLPDGAMVLNVTSLTIGLRLLTPAVKCTDWSDRDIPALNDHCGTDATGVILEAYLDFCTRSLIVDDPQMAFFQNDLNGTSRRLLQPKNI